MSKERRPGLQGQAFLTAGELVLGTAGFISGTVSAGSIIRSGEQYLMNAVEDTWQRDIFGFLIHVTHEVGIPVQATLAGIILASTALIIDGFRRNEWATNYFRNRLR